MSDEQIKHMVQQFLAWKLPADFYPDGGVVFERGDREIGSAWWPTGTNLLTYNQAIAMVQHMMAGLPDDELARIGAATKAAAERDGVEREAMAALLYGHFETAKPWTPERLAASIAHFATIKQHDSDEAREVVAEWTETAQAAVAALVAHAGADK